MKKFRLMFIVFCVIMSLFFVFSGCVNDLNNDDDDDDDNVYLDPLTKDNIADDGDTIRSLSDLYIYDGTVVFLYYEDSSDDLKCARSADHGETWSYVTIESSNDCGRFCELCGDQENLYAVYHYYDGSTHYVRFARSTDLGLTWEAISNIESLGTVDCISTPSICVNPGSVNLYVAYMNPNSGNNILKVGRSVNGGVSWTISDISGIETSDNYGQFSNIRIEGNYLYVAYVDETNSKYKIVRSTNYGDSFTLGAEIGNITVFSDKVMKLLVNGSNLYLFGMVDSGNKIFVWRYSESGTGLASGSASTVFSIFNNTFNQCINACFFGSAFIAMGTGTKTASDSDYEIDCVKSSDGSINWTSSSKIGGTAFQCGMYNSVTTDGTYVYCIYISNSPLMPPNGIVFSRAVLSDNTWVEYVHP